MVGPMVQRLVSLVSKAPPSAHTSGGSWYGDARRTCQDMAKRNGVSLAVAAGVVAALSPRLQWGPNLRAAEVVLSGGIPGGVFQASLRKALRIARGGQRPLTVLSGPKVRAFYRAIMGDESAAVVDTWVLKAVGWARAVTPKAYAAIARALQLAAERLGTTVARLQAIAWVAVRGRAQ
jgi:hypothetical protein